MGLFEKLFGKKSEPQKKSGDLFIEEMAKKIDQEKQKTGNVSPQTINEISKTLADNLFSGELEFTKDENWQASNVEINSSSSKSFSKNKEFSIHWNDGYQNEDKWMNGIVVLRQKGKDLWQKSVERPWDCKVANNGTVICNDSTLSSINYTEEIACKLLAFDVNGNEIINKTFTANIGDNFQISTDGIVAICDTLSSNTQDADSIFVFNLLTKNEIEQYDNSDYEVTKIKIDEVNKAVILKLEDDEYEIKY